MNGPCSIAVLTYQMIVTCSGPQKIAGRSQNHIFWPTPEPRIEKRDLCFTWALTKQVMCQQTIYIYNVINPMSSTIPKLSPVWFLVYKQFPVMVVVVYGRVSQSINLTNLWISIDPTNWTTQLLDVHPHYKVFINHFNKPVQHI